MEEAETKREGKKDANRHCLQLDLRIRLHDEVLRLRRRGLTYEDIIKDIYGRQGVMLNIASISNWVRGIHTPLGKVNKFDGKPSPELAGIIGVLLSDGNRYIDSNGNYILNLTVKDRDYADAFGHDLSKVLGKARPYKPRWSEHRQRWITAASSVLLFKYLDRPWQELKPYIETKQACVASFLRRFFDGEGCISGRALTVYNNDRERLLYVQFLLRRYFGIETTGPHKGTTKAGYRFRDPRTGKTYETKKQCYYVRVRVRSLSKFHKYVGFSIERKQRRLLDAIQK